MLITVIIPCYNEEKTLEKIVNKIRDQKDLNIKIILVDDNSKDLSSEIIKNNLMDKKVDKVIFHEKNLGKGACIKSAQPFVEGEYVIIQDADLEYNPENYKFLLNKMIKDQTKVVYGSRVLKEENNKRVQNFSHKLRIYGNYVLTKISNFFNNQKLTDAHTCYKIFRSDIFLQLNLQEDDFAFCPEVTTKISLLNEEIKESPISYQGRTLKEGKKIKFYDGIRALATILKYKYFIRF